MSQFGNEPVRGGTVPGRGGQGERERVALNPPPGSTDPERELAASKTLATNTRAAHCSVSQQLAGSNCTRKAELETHRIGDR